MQLFQRIALLLVAIAIAGCSSSAKYEPSANVANNLQVAADQLAKNQQAVTDTLSTMNALMAAPPTELADHYDDFNAAVDDLNAGAAQTKEVANDMRARGQAFFANWDEQSAAIQNEDIRTRSETRKAEVRASFDRVRDLYQQAQTSFQPFQANIGDIRTALGTDLTPAGVASVKDIAASATEHGRTLETTLAALVEEFRNLGASVSPTGGSN